MRIATTIHRLVLYGRKEGVKPVVGLLPLHAASAAAWHADPGAPRPEVQWVPAPSWVASMSPSTNAVPGAPVVRVAASSPVHQERLCELSLGDGRWTDADEPERVDGRRYLRQTLWATSGDGTRVPLTVVCAQEGPQPRPTLVEVYGAYGHCAVRVYDVIVWYHKMCRPGCVVQCWHSAAAAAWVERGGGARARWWGVWAAMAHGWGRDPQAAGRGRPQSMH